MSTVFVVGAGASKEVGLPLGSDLKLQIASLLDIRFDWHQMVSGSTEIAEAFRFVARQSGSGDINPHLHACWQIRDAMPQAISIDNYIDCHGGNERLEFAGKLSIALAILRAETNSALYLDYRRDANPKPPFDRLSKTWYAALWQLLSENCRLEGLHARLTQTTFITFNYDRCIEHFLYHACKNYYALNDADAIKVLASLTVLHAYGAVGTLPWATPRDSVHFGGMPQSTEHFVSLARGLRTFTEGTDEQASDIKLIRQRLAHADRIVFLGFAFHELNMRLLLPQIVNTASNKCAIYGTASGLSTSDAELVSTQLVNLLPTASGRVFLRRDLLCHTLFPEYWRSLRFN
jgi:hypothetical protein